MPVNTAIQPGLPANNTPSNGAEVEDGRTNSRLAGIEYGDSAQLRYDFIKHFVKPLSRERCECDNIPCNLFDSSSFRCLVGCDKQKSCDL